MMAFGNVEVESYVSLLFVSILFAYMLDEWMIFILSHYIVTCFFTPNQATMTHFSTYLSSDYRQ